MKKKSSPLPLATTPAALIKKKRDGAELTPSEIDFFIHSLLNGDLADYQATAFLMATFFNGMTLSETVALTRAMVTSGEHYNLTHLPRPAVDKHSTGGVGDKVSLILAPLAAACGLAVPMMSGRGLGHTGGTLDKLQCIPGFDPFITQDKFKSVLKLCGTSMIGQSANIAPADRKLYALRDVTGTVECIPLIVASILSKKVAEGAQFLVLDVKVGNGAFMKTKEMAKKLATTLIRVGGGLGLPTRAVLSDMNQPLGYAVGNTLEMLEAIELLRQGTESGTSSQDHILKEAENTSSLDLKELTLQLCAHMLHLSKAVKSLSEGRKLAMKKLQDGSAWKVFCTMVEAQGGNVKTLEDPLKLPLSSRKVIWRSPRSGYLNSFQTEELGNLLVEMGGGRKQATDTIDPSVGFIYHHKLGARVNQGEPLATVFLPESGPLSDATLIREIERRFYAAIEITPSRKRQPNLVLEILNEKPIKSPLKSRKSLT